MTTTNVDALTNRKIEHRREIDGLRALAVIPVILFHAEFDWFSGGFVGVDVFFVISGYLITSIILAELRSGEFSIAAFYERRARRILPALFVVLLVCLPLAWASMTPLQMRGFMQALLAVPLFGSNILFWRTTSYFDTAAEQRPLLHTWSLAVEEQYYLIFPLILVLLRQFGTVRLSWCLAVVAILSMALSQLKLSAGDVSYSFFLAPSRAWELLVGSLLAVASRRELLEQGKPLIKNVLSLVGLLLILASIAVYNKYSPFPGYRAVAPTLGAALIIAFADQTTAVGRLLSVRWVVGIGLISYSAYLWHQPLFAFARVYARTEPTHVTYGVLATLSTGLAYLSWRYVELPFRNRAKFTRIQIFSFAAIASTLFIAIGIAGHLTSGFERAYLARLEPAERERAQAISKAIATGGYGTLVDNGECKFSARFVSPTFRQRYSTCVKKYGQSVIVLGDSHAVDTYNAIAAVSKAPFIVSVSAGGCRPYPAEADCYYGKFARFLSESKHTVRVILFTQSGEYLLTDPNGHTVNTAAVEGTYAYLSGLAKFAEIIWLGPQPELHTDLRSVNLLIEKFDFRFKEQPAIVDRFLLNMDMEPITYVSKLESMRFRPEDLYVEGRFTYSDEDHWSTHGEKVFGRRLLANERIADALLASAGQNR